MNLLFILLPLHILSKLEGGLRGKTRLQKIVFLIQENLQKRGIDLDFDFEPAPYGPYSTSLAETVDLMCQKGFIKEELVGASKVLHVFTLEDAGKRILDGTQDHLSEQVKKAVEEVIEKFGETDLKDLLDFVHKKYPDFVKS